MEEAIINGVDISPDRVAVLLPVNMMQRFLRTTVEGIVMINVTVIVGLIVRMEHARKVKGLMRLTISTV